MNRIKLKNIFLGTIIMLLVISCSKDNSCSVENYFETRPFSDHLAIDLFGEIWHLSGNLMFGDGDGSITYDPNLTKHMYNCGTVGSVCEINRIPVEGWQSASCIGQGTGLILCTTIRDQNGNDSIRRFDRLFVEIFEYDEHTLKIKHLRFIVDDYWKEEMRGWVNDN